MLLSNGTSAPDVTAVPPMPHQERSNGHNAFTCAPTILATVTWCNRPYLPRSSLRKPVRFLAVRCQETFQRRARFSVAMYKSTIDQITGNRRHQFRGRMTFLLLVRAVPTRLAATTGFAPPQSCCLVHRRDDRVKRVTKCKRPSDDRGIPHFLIPLRATSYSPRTRLIHAQMSMSTTVAPTTSQPSPI